MFVWSKGQVFDHFFFSYRMLAMYISDFYHISNCVFKDTLFAFRQSAGCISLYMYMYIFLFSSLILL